MTNLQFTTAAVRPEPYAAVPTLVVRLRVLDTEGARIHAIALRCQIRDFEVTAAKYFHALEDGEIPLLLLFSGTIFVHDDTTGFRVEQVPWEKAVCRVPVKVWRDLMDAYFPGSAWIRLRRETFDALHRFKGQQALPGWDEAVQALLERRVVPEGEQV